MRSTAGFLGGKVFGAPDQLKRLTDIVWPVIRQSATAEIGELREREPQTVIVLEAAVLIEAEWQDLADEVWVVHVDPEVAKKRLMDRNNLDADAAQARIDSQITNEERLGHADVDISNGGTLNQFLAGIDGEWQNLQDRISSESGS